ncbi:hypothetical protein COU78_03450 [Candidatus Peregrinibacteria bacterium CG10_big_fil_rev_8_21_14_0_10_49_24]|nr:MAG: hypothetical protein COV83_05270 [Candidatus Peregrinibacteria bacterium CG11_big_fil_rev_8_21_14_0_20_49_14]PIR51175.1 MAG: hypothetical protein COU78_03450 [Candidatus Peregrinibacteria bacterium CG10_big_fil_rev_8_21_14_0_10_49_24]PJA67214.1 MAG: hypothetical protein CO157_05605 [Candidatus Peregrinibacteria bacterium CG_4_9_14_3_um_filter_49_12]
MIVITFSTRSTVHDFVVLHPLQKNTYLCYTTFVNTIAIALVLLSAFIHAFRDFFRKKSMDKPVFMWQFSAVSGNNHLRWLDKDFGSSQNFLRI